MNRTPKTQPKHETYTDDGDGCGERLIVFRDPTVSETHHPHLQRTIKIPVQAKWIHNVQEVKKETNHFPSNQTRRPERHIRCEGTHGEQALHTVQVDAINGATRYHRKVHTPPKSPRRANDHTNERKCSAVDSTGRIIGDAYTEIMAWHIKKQQEGKVM